jgi:hypothetical protein
MSNLNTESTLCILWFTGLALTPAESFTQALSGLYSEWITDKEKSECGQNSESNNFQESPMKA